MKKILFAALFSFVALVLFAGTFIGIARVRGAHLSELPVLRALFPAEKGAETASAPTDAPAPEPAPAPPSTPVQAAGLSVLDAFTVEAPFSTAQLRELVDALGKKEREAEQRLAAVAAKEAALAERVEVLDAQQESLRELRKELDARQAELLAKAAELEKDQAARSALEEEAWKTRGKLFEDGEPETLAERLVAYPPEDAARLLAALAPDRARELLDALPAARWREYAEAYTVRVSQKPAAHAAP